MKNVNTVGIDVSAKTLEVAINSVDKSVPTKTFENTSEGHRKLIKVITKRGRGARVVMEATGTFSMGLALALCDHPRIEVMVANPRAVKHFAKAILQRSKTDRVDARTILLFCQRMVFQGWERPGEEQLALRSLSRRMRQLSEEISKEKTRLHSKEYEGECGAFVGNDIQVNIRHLERRLALLEEKGKALIGAHEDLARKYALLLTIKGIGPVSALQLLGELCVLPKDMKPQNWVAHAGLDPRAEESGTSLHKPRRISKAGNKNLRAALYMPAMVGSTHCPHIAAFSNKLLGRQKKKKQAQVAVMRKLLHAIWGMFTYDEPWNGEKFHPLARQAEGGRP